MNTYTFRFLTDEEETEKPTCEHAAHASTEATAATIVQEATAGARWQADVFLCDDHAQEAADAQAERMRAAYPDAIFQGYNLYLEYGARASDASEKGKDGWQLAKLRKGRASHEKLFVRRIAHSQGNLVAVYAGQDDDQLRATGEHSAYVTVFFHANSAVNFGSVSRDYLAKNCERISRAQALQVGHSELFDRMKDDASRD